MQHRISSITSLLLSCFVTLPLVAEDWPSWRGANSDGKSSATGLATQWSASENVAWRAPLPGQGGATPVISGNTIFVTSADGDDLVLLSINKTSGKQNWQVKVTDQNQLARSSEGNSASASPVTDGQHVWVFFSRGEKFSSGILACYDFQGHEVWKFDVADRFGKIDIQFGMTSTPVLDADGLYLQLIHGPMKRGDNTRTGKIIKLNKMTGETIWETERVTEAVFENKHSYASPFMYDDGKQKFLVVHGADCTTAHDLKTGNEIWRFVGLNGPSEINKGDFDLYFRFVASPAVGDGIIIIPTCKKGPTVALRIDNSLQGEIPPTSDAVMWTLPETPDVSIPLIVDDLVYLLRKDGRLQCLDRETGEKVYYSRLHNVQYRSSPAYADGHLYFFGKDGVCSVVKAGREFEKVSENSMAGEEITASPAFSDGTLFVRTYDALYAIQE